MISDKLEALRADYEKVSIELDKLTQLKLKLMGAIEVLSQLDTEKNPNKDITKDGSNK